MINIIVIGHGHFASGIMSSLELIAGKQEGVQAIDFTSEMSQDDVKKRIETLLINHNNVFILCDLLGGTPFKMAATVMEENADKTIEVISGLNLSMLLEAAFSRANTDFDELSEMVKKAGNDGIVCAKELFDIQTSQEIESGF